MLKAGEGCLTPIFQDAEMIERGVLVKLSFVLLNEIEAHFKLLFEGLVRGGVRV